MKSSEIRTRFLNFFEARGHRVLPSSSLVPAHDPTLLFSNAGMNQFKDIFLGREKRVYARAATSQKCVRAGGKHNDLEQVGRTTRHHTFFEMLGNFSFGDYFKKEAIPWAWELVTREFAIPREKLYVTTFLGSGSGPEDHDLVPHDDEAHDLWVAQGVGNDRIFELGLKDNFWQMGDTGPCGPCSEIHYDLGPGASDLGHTECKFPCDCGRFVEIWNLVFMQYSRYCRYERDGYPAHWDEKARAEHKHSDDRYACLALDLLPKPCVDTGMGLERIAAVLQGKKSNYDTDLFRPLIEEAAGLANVEYGANHDTDVSLRIIADHARATTFLISDGVLPSNEGRGYVLRLIMRRALYHGQTLGLNEPFLYKMSGHVVQMMKDAYPELVEAEHHIAKAIRIEEERYAHTTRLALERLETVAVVVSSGEELPFHLARRLHIPISMHARYAHEKGSGLKDTFDRRYDIHAADDERAALKEFESTWSRDAFSRRISDWVLTRLPEGVSKHAWMDDFRQTVGQEVGNLTPYVSFRGTVQGIQERWKENRLVREALDSFMRRFPPQNIAAWIPGDELFKLHDTFGLRPEFIEDLVNVYGFAVDREGYEAEMQKQRERARANWKAATRDVAHGADAFIVIETLQQLADKHPTRFEGYGQTTSYQCKVVGLLEDGKLVGQVESGAKADIILDHTPFYAEGGGQVGDAGRFYASDSTQEVAHVNDTYAPVVAHNEGTSPFGGKDIVDYATAGGLIAHKAVAHARLRVGDTVTAVVDSERRDAVRRNHTATHLLHAALRKTLGTHVKQAGSLVAPDRLRFDFTHYAALDEQDLLDIEDLVNEHILKNEVVATEEKDLDSAVAGGAMALFGEKYADKVRVLSINDFSKELCGGTHVRRTGDIGLFKIVSESSVAAGTRRIEAVTGEGVLKYLRQASETLALLADSLHAKPEELLQAVEKLSDSEKKLRKELEAQRQKGAEASLGEVLSRATKVKGVFVIAQKIPEPIDRAALRNLADRCRAQIKSGVVVLGNVVDGKVSLVAAVTKDLTHKLDAGKIVKQAAAIVEGSGGGRKDLAEAGGKNPAKLDESLQAVPAIIEAML